MDDNRIRLAVLNVLQGAQGAAVVRSTRALIDDPDIEVEDSALAALAFNQVVDVIPRIAEIQRQKALLRRTSRAVMMLNAYKTPEATPYLNVLLFDIGSQYTRLNAIDALNQNGLADNTSIPFLMVALRDPEPQGEVASTAYRLLHKLIPTLGPAKDRAAFLKAPREPEIKAIDDWWSNRLAAESITTGRRGGSRNPSAQPQR